MYSNGVGTKRQLSWYESAMLAPFSLFSLFCSLSLIHFGVLSRSLPRSRSPPLSLSVSLSLSLSLSHSLSHFLSRFLSLLFSLSYIHIYI